MLRFVFYTSSRESSQKTRMLKILLLILAVLLVLSGCVVRKNLTVPVILGVNDGKLTSLPDSPNGVSSQAADAEKRVDPLPFVGASADLTLTKIESVLSELSGNTIKTRSKDYLHVVFITPGFRFRDDVEFYLNREKLQVEFRSQSRIGHSDLGVNRKRYESFRNLYLK